jgi:enoyl-CoA hydratase/carnithine racemase
MVDDRSPPMTTAPVLVERTAGILHVTLNRPKRLNALDWGMRLALEALWTESARDLGLRCIVLTGAGQGFCSGADVDDLIGERRPHGRDLDAELAFLPGRRLPVPVIVAVNGVCAGGGLHFVADADMVLAGSSASFLDPHVSVGQVSGIEPVSLAARTSVSTVSYLALGGHAARLDARAAQTAGLVAEVVADPDLPARAMELAAAVADASPTAVRETRRLIRAFERAALEPWMAEGWERVQRHWHHPDAAEGPSAYSERRRPAWPDDPP